MKARLSYRSASRHPQQGARGGALNRLRGERTLTCYPGRQEENIIGSLT